MKSMRKFNINKLSFSRILLLLLGTVIICVFMQNMRSIEGLTTGCSVNPNPGTLNPNPNSAYTCPLSNSRCAICDSKFTQTQCSDYSSQRSSSDPSNSYCLWNTKPIQMVNPTVV